MSRDSPYNVVHFASASRGALDNTVHEAECYAAQGVEICVPTSQTMKGETWWDCVKAWFLPCYTVCCLEGWELEAAEVHRVAMEETRKQMRMQLGYRSCNLRADLEAVERQVQVLLLQHESLPPKIGADGGVIPLVGQLVPPLGEGINHPPVMASQVVNHGVVGLGVVVRERALVDTPVPDAWTPTPPRQPLPAVSMIHFMPKFAARMVLHLEADLSRLADNPANRGVASRRLTGMCREVNVRHEVVHLHHDMILEVFFGLSDGEMLALGSRRMPRLRKYTFATRRQPSDH